MSVPIGVGTRSGARVGQYRLVQPLGEGEFGRVYLALDASGRAVVVKFLKRGPLDHLPSGRSKRFERLQSISHPGIAQVLDFDLLSEEPLLVSRYIPGPQLGVVIRETGSISRNEVLSLGIKLAESIEFAHAVGILHGDLKPSNIVMLDQQPVLIDFGDSLDMAAAISEQYPDGGLVMGTPGYLSPELINGDAQFTEAIDWWGLGATLAFAATGRPPMALT